MKLMSFNNNQELKNQCINEIEQFFSKKIKFDESFLWHLHNFGDGGISKKIFGDQFNVELKFSIPSELIHAIDVIWIELNPKDRQEYLLNFYKSIPLNADLRPVKTRMQLYMLEDPKYGLINFINEGKDKTRVIEDIGTTFPDFLKAKLIESYDMEMIEDYTQVEISIGKYRNTVIHLMKKDFINENKDVMRAALDVIQRGIPGLNGMYHKKIMFHDLAKAISSYIIFFSEDKREEISKGLVRAFIDIFTKINDLNKRIPIRESYDDIIKKAKVIKLKESIRKSELEIEDIIPNFLNYFFNEYYHVIYKIRVNHDLKTVSYNFIYGGIYEHTLKFSDIKHYILNELKFKDRFGIQKEFVELFQKLLTLI